MAMFTDTPVTTIVAHAEVAEHGVEVGAGHRVEAVEAAEHEVALDRSELGHDLHLGVPGSSATSLLRTAWNRRAFVFEPQPSARRSAVQWTTWAPAARAAVHRRAALAMAGRAAAASSGSDRALPDHAVLQLRGDDRGRRRRRRGRAGPRARGGL